MEKQTKLMERNPIQFRINEKKQNSLFKAMLKTLAISSLIGIAYGMLNYTLSTNFIIMPIIGVAAVSYVYNTNYHEEYINIPIRLLLGMLCSMQILIAFFVCEIAYSEVPLYPANLQLIISEYMRYTLENPMKQAAPLFLMAICFAYGALQDYTLRLQMLIRKYFLKKLGRYYYKKEGQMVSIYIIDPVEYDENERNRLIAYITDGCYFEIYQKSLKAFYLPKQNLDEAEIHIQNDGIASIGGNEYYKLDFGSTGACIKYCAPCALIMDNSQNVEVVQIEI